MELKLEITQYLNVGDLMRLGAVSRTLRADVRLLDPIRIAIGREEIHPSPLWPPAWQWPGMQAVALALIARCRRDVQGKGIGRLYEVSSLNEFLRSTEPSKRAEVGNLLPEVTEAMAISLRAHSADLRMPLAEREAWQDCMRILLNFTDDAWTDEFKWKFGRAVKALAREKGRKITGREHYQLVHTVSWGLDPARYKKYKASRAFFTRTAALRNAAELRDPRLRAALRARRTHLAEEAADSVVDMIERAPAVEGAQFELLTVVAQQLTGAWVAFSLNPLRKVRPAVFEPIRQAFLEALCEVPPGDYTWEGPVARAIDMIESESHWLKEMCTKARDHLTANRNKEAQGQRRR